MRFAIASPAVMTTADVASPLPHITANIGSTLEGRRALRNLWQKGRILWAKFSNTNAATHASSISYFSFLSLVPVLAICISLISLTGVDQQEILEFLQKLVPDALQGFARELIDDAFERSGLAFSLSTVTLLWTASKSAKALRGGLNAAYLEQETRSAPVVIAISVVAIIILGLLIAAVMYLVFGGSVLHAIASKFPEIEEQYGLTTFFNACVTMGLGVLSLAACYSYLPAGKRRLVAQLPGAALAVAACGIFSFGFRVYVDNFANYTKLYGSLATIAMLLFWMYLTFYILLAGAFVNRCLAERIQQRPRS